MRFVVKGSSMEPTFREGDRLFASRLFYFEAAVGGRETSHHPLWTGIISLWYKVAHWLFKPKIGDIVVLEHPFRRILIVKRIKKITSASVEVTGDNPRKSEDSAAFGLLPLNSIKGKVLFRY